MTLPQSWSRILYSTLDIPRQDQGKTCQCLCQCSLSWQTLYTVSVLPRTSIDIERISIELQTFVDKIIFGPAAAVLPTTPTSRLSTRLCRLLLAFCCQNWRARWFLLGCIHAHGNLPGLCYSHFSVSTFGHWLNNPTSIFLCSRQVLAAS
jgi:hypothetical protein